MKKIMSLLLCVMLVVTMMPAIAWAEGENIGGGETVSEEFTRWTIVYSETLLEEDDYPATYGDISIHMNLKATEGENSAKGYFYAAKFTQTEIKSRNCANDWICTVPLLHFFFYLWDNCDKI